MVTSLRQRCGGGKAECVIPTSKLCIPNHPSQFSHYHYFHSNDHPLHIINFSIIDSSQNKRDLRTLESKRVHYPREPINQH